MRTSIKSLVQSPEVPGSQSFCSGIVHATAPEDSDPTPFSIPPENLYDLDIDSDYSDSSDYRSLSDMHSHLRKTLSETFSSYSLDQASNGVDAAFEEENYQAEFVISNTNIVLHPGENELQLFGEVAVLLLLHKY